MTQLKKTSSAALADSLRALAHLGGAAKEGDVAEWTGLSTTTVRHAARFLEHCGLVGVKGGILTATQDMPRSLQRPDAVTVISNALSGIDSFVALAASLQAGDTWEDAVRRAPLSEPSLGSSTSAKVVLDFALEMGLIDRSLDGTYRVGTAIQRGAAELVAPDTAAGSAQLALRGIMGAAPYRSLERTERDRLAQALCLIETDPGGACEDAGKAAENYLRLVATNAGVDASGCSGLGSVADTLAAKSAAVIRPQHRTIAHQVAMARNASGHERDRYTLQSWEKTPAIARASVILSPRLIASVHVWIGEGRQVLQLFGRE